MASTHAYVLVFTDRGKVYWLKVHEIPQAGRATRGKPIVNLIRIEKGEAISAVLPVNEFVEGQFVVMATARGTIKKTDLMAFAHPRPSGLIALSIDEGDKLIKVGITDGQREIIMATREGLAVRFPEEQVRPMGRTARGVRAVTLKRDGDAVVGMVILTDSVPQVLTVCENGYGKAYGGGRVPFAEPRWLGHHQYQGERAQWRRGQRLRRQRRRQCDGGDQPRHDDSHHSGADFLARSRHSGRAYHQCQ